MNESKLNTKPVRLLIGLILPILMLAQSGQTQKIFDPPRMVLDYRCPSYVLAGNTPITMRAEVIGAKALDEQQAKRIVFNWELSGGKLLTGQTTGTIMIDSSALPKDDVSCIDVRLEVEGAPPEVERDKTCRLRIDPKCTPPGIFEEYGSLSTRDENRHLDRFAEYLKGAGQEATAYIVSYSGRSACVYEAQWRADRVKNYLVEKHSLSRDRIIAVDGGVRESWNVDLFAQSQGSCGPQPSPALLRDEAHVSGQCSQKY